MSSRGATQHRPEREPVTGRVRVRAVDRRWGEALPRLRIGLAPALVLLVGLIVGAAICLVQTRGTTLSFDEWEWALGRRGLTADTFLRPHNGHFSLVPLIVYKLMFVTVGIRHYLPYRLIVTALHLACVTLVFLYARRRVGELAALLAAAWILFLSPGWQNFLWPFQLAWLISIAAGLGAWIALDRGDRRGDVAASGLLAVSLASSGVGMAIAAGLCVEMLASRSRRRLGIVAGPLVLFALWWIAYQDSSTTAAAIRHAPLFAAKEAAASVAGLAGLAGNSIPLGSGTLLTYGPPLAIAAALALVWALVRGGRASVRVFALSATVCAFWILTGLGRAGLAQPYSSRYLYVSGLFLVVLAAELLREVRIRPLVAGLAALLITAAIVSNLTMFGLAGRFERDQAQTTVADLGALDIARNAVSPSYVPARFPGLGLTFKVGAYYAMERSIGTPAATPAQIQALPEGPREIADLELLSMHKAGLRVARSLRSLGRAPGAQALGGAVTRVRGACVSVTPGAAAGGVDLTLPAAGLLLRGSGSPVAVLARRFASNPSPVGVVTGLVPRRLSIGSDASSVPWRVRIVSGGPFAACGLVASGAPTG